MAGNAYSLTTDESARVREEVDNFITDYCANAPTTFNALFQKTDAASVNALGRRHADRIRPNPSFAGGGELVAYARGGSDTKRFRRVFYQRVTATYLISSEARRMIKSQAAVKNYRGAAKIMAHEIAGTLDAMQHKENVLLHTLDGTIGTLSARVTGAAGTMTFADAADTIRSRWLEIGGRYVVVSSVGVARVNGGSSPFIATMSAINRTTHVGTFDTVPSDAVVGDKIMYEALNGGRCPKTIWQIIKNTNDASFYGVDTSVNPEYKSQVRSLANGYLSLAALNWLESAQVHVAGVDGYEQSDACLISNTNLTDVYKGLGDSKRVFNDVFSLLDLSIKKVEHGHMWLKDPAARPDRIMRVRKRDWRLVEEKGLGAVDLGFGDNPAPSLIADADGTVRYISGQQSSFEHNYEVWCDQTNIQAGLIDVHPGDAAGNVYYLPQHVMGGN